MYVRYMYVLKHFKKLCLMSTVSIYFKDILKECMEIEAHILINETMHLYEEILTLLFGNPFYPRVFVGD